MSKVMVAIVPVQTVFNVLTLSFVGRIPLYKGLMSRELGQIFFFPNLVKVQGHSGDNTFVKVHCQGSLHTISSCSEVNL